MVASIREHLNTIPEAEVIGENEQGKLIVVLDTADNRQAADQITAIQNQAGVLSATLIYQYDYRIESKLEDSA